MDKDKIREEVLADEELAAKLESQFLRDEDNEVVKPVTEERLSDASITSEYIKKEEAILETSYNSTNLKAEEGNVLEEPMEESHNRLTYQNIENLVSSFEKGLDKQNYTITQQTMQTTSISNDENEMTESYQANVEHVAISPNDYDNQDAYEVKKETAVEEKIILTRIVQKSEEDKLVDDETVRSTHETTEINRGNRRVLTYTVINLSIVNL